MIIDLRSDTVTKPSKEMLQAMLTAQVGDDVFMEDPTVNELEELSAKMFGKEAGLFCPSGTMTNQIAAKAHTAPGEEVILHKYSHLYYYEGGGLMTNSGVSVALINNDSGMINSEEVLDNINPNEIHRPKTSLVCVENTMNKGGGVVYCNKELASISEICKKYKLYYHLDGARVFNALAVTNQPSFECGRIFDSISICLSKGLGAPVGSVLIGNKGFIDKARRIRKRFGGGMRQAGYIAAAGIYALKNNIERLKEDHTRAKEIESSLKNLNWVEKVIPVETNIIIFKVKLPLTAHETMYKLNEKGIKSFSIDKQSIRFVTHLDFNDKMLEQTKSILKNLY